jgi:Ca2+-dependent lipid-binding protein
MAGKKVGRTKTIPKTLNPVWNKQFFFDIFDDDGQVPTVKFEVFDEDFAGDDPLGYFEVELKNCFEKPKTWVFNKDYALWDKERKAPQGSLGSLTVFIAYIPTGTDPYLPLPGHKVDGRINVHVWKATDIKAADFGGKSDAYCVVRLDGNEIGKTPIITSLTPEWREQYIADLLDDETVLFIDSFRKLASREKFHSSKCNYSTRMRSVQMMRWEKWRLM